MIAHAQTHSLLAQELTGEGMVRILLASGAMVLLMMIGYFLVSRLRRRLQEPEGPAAAAGFTLADLRELHKSGQMSDEEFERAKAKVVEAARRAAERAEAHRQAEQKNDGGASS